MRSAHALPRAVSLRAVALAAAAASLLALAVAVGSERYGGLVPCALCLLERWPYRAAAVLAVLAAVASRGVAQPLLWLVVLAALAAAALGFVHVGVEQGWWPSPLPECAAPHIATTGSFAQRLASLPARPAKPCDDPTYLVPGLPLSMAAMNLLYALALAGGTAAALLRRPRG